MAWKSGIETLLVWLSRWTYTRLLKPVFFRFDAEQVHAQVTKFGERLGAIPAARGAIGVIFGRPDPALFQTLFGISFASPLGLAAGFDYEARLTGILPSFGFGFGTVGTLTNRSHGGNPRPLLGRLPRSRSLMVNKGFKNRGVAATLDGLRDRAFAYPVGVSIGKTNDPTLTTHAHAIADIIAGFRAAEASGVPFAYYELNISCPNLIGSVDFYKPEHFEGLLRAVHNLRLARPVFVKMPISRSDDEIRALLDSIIHYPSFPAVILGNLQRDRTDPAFDPDEVARFPIGNFSGLPCQRRSDELIRLAYREYGARIRIIGCGGVFSADDAYRKIAFGASLVQLITGLIFEGPQIVADINRQLPRSLRRDGYASIRDAIGSAA